MTTDPHILSKAVFEWWWIDEGHRSKLIHSRSQPSLLSAAEALLRFPEEWKSETKKPIESDPASPSDVVRLPTRAPSHRPFGCFSDGFDDPRSLHLILNPCFLTQNFDAAGPECIAIPHGRNRSPLVTPRLRGFAAERRRRCGAEGRRRGEAGQGGPTSMSRGRNGDGVFHVNRSTSLKWNNRSSVPLRFRFRLFQDAASSASFNPSPL
jgi:hypothetical protein